MLEEPGPRPGFQFTASSIVDLLYCPSAPLPLCELRIVCLMEGFSKPAASPHPIVASIGSQQARNRRKPAGLDEEGWL